MTVSNTSLYRYYTGGVCGAATAPVRWNKMAVEFSVAGNGVVQEEGAELQRMSYLPPALQGKTE